MSPAKIEANILNATHSTGPTSAAGKAISSGNAISHGLTARHAVLPTENAADYKALVNELMDQYRPASLMQRALVQEFADVAWRLQRVRFIETQIMTREMAAIAAEPENANQDPNLTMALAFERLIERKVLTNLYAQEGRLNSRLYKLQGRLAGIEPMTQRFAPSCPAAPPPPPPPQVAEKPKDIEIRKNEPIRVAPQPGRNEVCPCGSGLKFKRCCLNRPQSDEILAAAA
jgi:hypothetical protein